MSRGVTTAMQSALEEGTIKKVLFVEMDFSSGTTRLWSGYGQITWDSKTWYGSGTLGTIGNIQETQELKAANLTLQLSGVPPEMQAIALDRAEYQGKVCKLWFGLLNDELQVVASPVRIFTGRMDVMTSDDFGPSCMLSLTVENRLVDMYRAREKRWTDQEQKTISPTDRGLEYVAALQDKEIVWGR